MSLKEKSKPNTTNYSNIMEILVEKEVEKQLSQINPRALKFIDPIQVSTFALNRLPSLYASSQEGKYKQTQRVINNKNLQLEITKAVRQGIAAVQRDPLRKSTPLPQEDENIDHLNKALNTLKELETLLKEKKLMVKNKELNWTNVVHYVNFALENATILNMSAEQKQKIIKRFKKWQEKRSFYDWGDHRYHS